MWVVLVVGILNKEFDCGRVDRLQKKLREIPGELHQLFRDILTRDSDNREELVLCIQWVLFAKDPLSPKELYFAILSGSDPDSVSAHDPEVIDAGNIKRFILDSSKGLIDITVSKNQKVQFIHESVRDFLLKENVLGKIWPEYKNNFTGQSHDKLAQCCLNHLTDNLESSLQVPNTLPNANSQEAKDLRLSVTQQYPFLEYAVCNALHHANEAEGCDFSQAGFLSRLQMGRWVRVSNILEKHEIRKHTQFVSRLYAMAELDCDNLIRSHLEPNLCLNIETERYGCPLFAAYALKSTRVLQSFWLALLPVDRGHNDDLIASAVTDEFSQQDTHRPFYYLPSLNFFSNTVKILSERWVVRIIWSRKFANIIENPYRSRALYWASSQGHTTLVTHILANHAATIDGDKQKGQVPLCAASKGGFESTVKVLVEKGADIAVMGLEDTGQLFGNALHAAAYGRHLGIASFLLDKRVDLVDKRDTWGSTPLLIAIRQGDESMVRLLIRRGADIGARRQSGNNAIHMASELNRIEMTRFLLHNRPDLVDTKTTSDETPLYVAAYNGHQEITKMLLRNGADVNAQGGRCGNALQAALISGSKDIVELLLDRGANVNTRDGEFGSALKFASIRNHKEIVSLLIARGAM